MSTPATPAAAGRFPASVRVAGLVGSGRRGRARRSGLGRLLVVRAARRQRERGGTGGDRGGDAESGHAERYARPAAAVRARVASAGVEVHVEWDERYWYPEDGGVVWLAGYSVVEPESGAYLARDAPELAAAGLRVTGVAGAARHHAAALASDAAAPGRALVLRRDAGNVHDANAIAVATADGETLGFVP